MDKTLPRDRIAMLILRNVQVGQTLSHLSRHSTSTRISYQGQFRQAGSRAQASESPTWKRWPSNLAGVNLISLHIQPQLDCMKLTSIRSSAPRTREEDVSFRDRVSPFAWTRLTNIWKREYTHLESLLIGQSSLSRKARRRGGVILQYYLPHRKKYAQDALGEQGENLDYSGVQNATDGNALN